MIKRKIIFIFLFIFACIFIIQSAYSNSTEDFLREYICDIYTEYKNKLDSKNDITWKDFIGTEYQYVNRTLRLIERYDDVIVGKQHQKLMSMKNSFFRYRSKLDDMIELTPNSYKSSLNDIHNMLDDHEFDLFNFYILDDGQLTRKVISLKDDQWEIEKVMFFLMEEVDPYDGFNCN